MDYSLITEIPFEKAIEGPLLACNQAQSQILDDIYRYLQDRMWEPDGKGAFKPVCEEFLFMQEGGGAQRMRVPRMSLFPSPSLQLDELTIRFQARITSVSSKKMTVRMLGENTEPVSESEELHSYLTVRLHAGVSDMPMGLATLYQFCTDRLVSMTSVEEDEQSPAETEPTPPGEDEPVPWPGGSGDGVSSGSGSSSAMLRLGMDIFESMPGGRMLAESR